MSTFLEIICEMNYFNNRYLVESESFLSMPRSPENENCIKDLTQFIKCNFFSNLTTQDGLTILTLAQGVKKHSRCKNPAVGFIIVSFFWGIEFESGIIQ